MLGMGTENFYQQICLRQLNESPGRKIGSCRIYALVGLANKLFEEKSGPKAIFRIIFLQPPLFSEKSNIYQFETIKKHQKRSATHGTQFGERLHD
jgi:hypothetical protein